MLATHGLDPRRPPAGAASAVARCSPRTGHRRRDALRRPGRPPAAARRRPTRAPQTCAPRRSGATRPTSGRCAEQLADVGADRLSCVKAPTPDAPDSGMAGWFATRPDAYDEPGIKGIYTRYGYAGYDYTTYDIGCCADA